MLDKQYDYVVIAPRLGDPEFKIRFKMNHDFGLQRYLRNKRLSVYEPEVVAAMARFCKLGDVVVEGGASNGYLTLVAASLVGPTGKVLAFEPNPDSREKLLGNIELNDHLARSVAVSSCALWDGKSNDLLKFHLTEQPGYSSVIPYDNAVGHIHVEQIGIDALFPETSPRLIKLDCEGAEAAILDGAEQTLRRGVDCVIVEFNWSTMQFLGTHEEMIRHYMANLGYDMFLLSPTDFLPQLVPVETRFTSQTLNLNVMFSTVDTVAAHWPNIEVP